MRKSENLVIIPAHNEEESIREVVSGALEHADVSVTDDGSRDGTPDVLRDIQQECAAGKFNHSLNVITHERATHIPQGIQDGLKFGVKRGYNFMVTMDAGLSHDPRALPQFFQHDPAIDVLIGMRREGQNVPFYRKAVSRMAALVVNYSLTPDLFHVRGPGLHDCTSGYRRYSFRAAERIALAELKSKAFDFHMEALAIPIRLGMKAGEIPITYVFSNSSFNGRVLKHAIKFGLHLIKTKKLHESEASPVLQQE